MKIILDGVIETLQTRQDGSVSIKYSTQELDSSKGGELFQLRGKYCKALFSDTNITDLEAEMVDSTKMAATKKNKTPSQRLRSVLFRCFEQSGESDFDVFYLNEMNKIIETYKLGLD